MKILMCCHEYYPSGSGIANLVYNLKKSMTKLGHSVDICSPIGPDYKIKVNKIIDIIGGIGIAYFWYKVGNLLKKIEPNYDIIYLHNPRLFTKIKSNKIRCVIHTLYYFSFKEYGWRDFIKWPYYFVMLVIEKLSYIYLNKFKFIVTSPKTVKELRHYGIKSNIPTMYNGHDFTTKAKVLPKRLNFLKSKEGIKLLFVGRLVRQKNLFGLMNVFRYLEKINKKYLLVIVSGGGKLKSRLQKYINKNKIKNARILDKINHEELLGIYNYFDYFISASHYEGFPLVLSEALANGLIPILSPIEIFKHVIKKINSGMIVDFNKSPEDAALKIDEYCRIVNIKKKSSKIRNEAKKIFNWDNIAKDYLDFEKKF